MKKLLLFLLLLPCVAYAQTEPDAYFAPAKYRSIGPFRGGRSVAAQGLPDDPLTAYMGSTGGGVWKTTDAGQRWHNISDGFFKTGSVGALAVAPNDKNVIYVGMGEHAPRGVMSSHGDGVYKSTDAGKTWTHLGLELTRQIAGIVVHPDDSDVVYVAAQGAYSGATKERGIYKSTDGGETWKNVLFVDENSGCSHLVMDPSNARVLYAAMWDHRRLPWQIRSGGPGSGLYKSTDAGKTWNKIEEGLPNELGKMSISVCASNPDKLYALVESDSNKEQGGLFVSADAGAKWSRISKDHRLVQRAWYYIEVFADPTNENTVYVLNAPALKSIDGGKTWKQLSGTHGDHHHLWINPTDGNHLVLANDGGAAISFNGGETWSTQANMPTSQFYRINVDNHFPYRVYAGQQDYGSVRIDHRNVSGGSITADNWTASAGGESAFLAFDPDNPRYVLGGSYQGTIEALDSKTGESRNIMAAPNQYLAEEAGDMTYRFNWNAPILRDHHAENVFYHGSNKLLMTEDMGKSWTEISPDLTRNDRAKQGKGGAPYTNEGAGGENYGTLAYLTDSPHAAGELWAGSDDGLVQLTRDGGETWTDVTPAGFEECLINAIEISPRDPGTAYIATTRYKFNDLRPAIFVTRNYGKSWDRINNGIPTGSYARVVRADPEVEGLLFAGTETGVYVSYDDGKRWTPLQSNLPVTPVTDLRVHQGDLIVATSGRSFWVYDDLELLRQYTTGQDAAFRLYTPADVYRLSARGGMNGNKSTGASPTSGVNPASGAVIYYELTAAEVEAGVVLEISDADGNTIRKLSSAKDNTFKSYAGGPSADPVLPAGAGLNRFVWNLRHASLTGAPEAYIEGSYAGRRVVPGTYELRLAQADDEDMVKTASFELLGHPEINAGPIEYAAQSDFLRTVSEQINAIHGTVNEMAKTKENIKRRAGDLEDLERGKELQEIGRQLMERMDAWEKQLIQRKSRAYDDVINFPNGLTANYLFLKGQADTNTPNVTEPMKARLRELDAKWAPLAAEYRALKEKVEEYERSLKEAGLGVIR